MAEAGKVPFAEQLAVRVKPYLDKLAITTLEEVETKVDALLGNSSDLEVSVKDIRDTLAQLIASIDEESSSDESWEESLNKIKDELKEAIISTNSNTPEVDTESKEAVIRNTADVRKPVAAGKTTVLQEVVGLREDLEEQEEEEQEEEEQQEEEQKIEDKKSEEKVQSIERKVTTAKVVAAERHNNLIKNIKALQPKDWKSKLSQLLNIVLLFLAFKDEIIAAGKEIKEKFVEWWNDNWPTFKDELLDGINNLLDKIPVIGFIRDAVENIWSWVREFLGGDTKYSFNKGSMTIEGVAEDLDKINDVQSLIDYETRLSRHPHFKELNDPMKQFIAQSINSKYSQLGGRPVGVDSRITAEGAPNAYYVKTSPTGDSADESFNVVPSHSIVGALEGSSYYTSDEFMDRAKAAKVTPEALKSAILNTLSGIKSNTQSEDYAAAVEAVKNDPSLLTPSDEWMGSHGDDYLQTYSPTPGGGRVVNNINITNLYESISNIKEDLVKTL